MLEPRTPVNRLQVPLQFRANSKLRSPSAHSATTISKTRTQFIGQPLEVHVPKDHEEQKTLNYQSSPISSLIPDIQWRKNTLAPLGEHGITPWPKKRTKNRIRSPLVPADLRSEPQAEGASSDISRITELGRHRLSLSTPVKKYTTGRNRTYCLKLEALSAPPDDLFPNTAPLRSLPSQVLQHTPSKHKELVAALGLDPTQPVKKRTIWTMLDEIRLVRSDGLLTGADALEPMEDARVVPLCQRRCNGMATSDSPLARRWTILGTPAKSEMSVAVDTPGFVRSPKPSSGDGSPSLLVDKPKLSVQARALSASYEWSLISVRWKTAGDHSSTNTTSPNRKFLKPTQRSLLTRAHTLVRFIGSKKSFGRS